MAQGSSPRIATITRTTAETDIRLTLAVDGRGTAKIDTGIPFFDHMLTLFAKHGLFDLEISAKGDVAVDYHHTVEDVGLVLGEAFKQALGAKEFDAVNLQRPAGPGDVQMLWADAQNRTSPAAR